MGGQRFDILSKSGRIVGQSAFQGDVGEGIVSAAVDLPEARCRLTVEFRAAKLVRAYARRITLLRSGSFTEEFWLEPTSSGWKLTRRKLGESWTEFLKPCEDLYIVGEGMVSEWCRLYSRRGKTEHKEVGYYDIEQRLAGVIRITRADATSIEVTLKPNCPHAKGATSIRVEGSRERGSRIFWPAFGIEARATSGRNKIEREVEPLPAATLTLEKGDPVGVESEHEAVSFDGVKLAASLEEPRRGAHSATVLLVHGSGSETRDSGSGYEGRDITSAPSQPFRELSRRLATAGISTLRFDKRGIGRSGGSFTDISREVLLKDLLAVIDLAARLRPDRVLVLAGFSEGGGLAISAARVRPAVSRLVLGACPARPIDRVILRKIEAKMRRAGSTTVQVRRRVSHLRAFFRKVRSLERRRGNQSVPGLFMGYPFAYWAEQLAFVPMEHATAVKAPILLLHGKSDYEVLPEEAGMMGRRLRESSRKFELAMFDRLNHFFTPACEDFPGFEYDVPYPMPKPVVDAIIRFAGGVPQG